MSHKEESILLGTTTEHLAASGGYAGVLHAEVVQAFEGLVQQARSAGFELRIISGYRSFHRQLGIWNAKAKGERAVLDDADNLIEMDKLSDLQKIEAIMRFSALPGASRHHWGTDFDVYDAAAINDDYQVQLTVSETQCEGVFADLHRWLDTALLKTEFYRPYKFDAGGVSVEPWHLSYRPISCEYAKQINPEILINTYQQVEIELFDCIEENIEMLFERFVQVL